MSRTGGLNFFLAAAVIGTSLFLQVAGEVPCTPEAFKCFDGRCMARGWFCDKGNDCGDNSDEAFCDIDDGRSCPSTWISCTNLRRCIPGHWWCDGKVDCQDASDEADCGVKSARPARMKLLKLLHQRRKDDSSTDQWGPQLHRIVVALHLADDPAIRPKTTWAQEMRYELIIQLFHRFLKEKRLSSQELALYIHALMVTCMNPRDFYGENLVLELRERVEKGSNYTNPFLILALCNAGDAMTRKDVDRVVAAYDSQQRPFWTDTQALASMALSCLSVRTGLIIDERTLQDMLQELKKRQFRNGTVDNFKTTSLVTQALLVHASFKKDFDLSAAIGVVAEGSGNNCSLLDAYYALPVLSGKSLLNVTSSHCTRAPVTEAEALQKALNANGETVAVKYSVWIGDKTDLARTWRLKMRVNETVYDVLETVARIDNRQKVVYNIVDGKPYVTALGGMEDDPEMETYWFFYLKPPNAEEPEIKDEKVIISEKNRSSTTSKMDGFRTTMVSNVNGARIQNLQGSNKVISLYNDQIQNFQGSNKVISLFNVLIQTLQGSNNVITVTDSRIVTLQGSNSVITVTDSRIELFQGSNNDITVNKGWIRIFQGSNNAIKVNDFWNQHLQGSNNVVTFNAVRRLDLHEEEKPVNITGIITTSPVDVRVQANQEIIMWYRRGQWSKSSFVTESAPSTT